MYKEKEIKIIELCPIRVPSSNVWKVWGAILANLINCSLLKSKNIYLHFFQKEAALKEEENVGEDFQIQS